MSGAQTLWICPPLFKSSRSNVEAVVMFEHAGVAMELVLPKFMVPKAGETAPPVALTTPAMSSNRPHTNGHPQGHSATFALSKDDAP